jgi:hypothetical protein
MSAGTRTKTEALGHRLLEKALLPVVAAAATAATTYAARKAPQLLDEALGPRVREITDGPDGSTTRTTTRTLSTDELERRRTERAKHRSTRRRTSR